MTFSKVEDTVRRLRRDSKEKRGQQKEEREREIITERPIGVVTTRGRGSNRNQLESLKFRSTSSLTDLENFLFFFVYTQDPVKEGTLRLSRSHHTLIILPKRLKGSIQIYIWSYHLLTRRRFEMTGILLYTKPEVRRGISFFSSLYY